MQKGIRSFFQILCFFPQKIRRQTNAFRTRSLACALDFAAGFRSGRITKCRAQGGTVRLIRKQHRRIKSSAETFGGASAAADGEFGYN